jgi:hypothetical protein
LLKYPQKVISLEHKWVHTALSEVMEDMASTINKF